MALRVISLLFSTVLILAAPRSLRIEVLSGEGTTYVAGTRSSTGLVVRVLDESGRPVEGAKVRFEAPAREPHVTFAADLPVQTVETGADGRAEIWGLKASESPGRFEILVTAAVGPVRGEAVIAQSIILPDQAPKASGSRKWIWILAAAAAGGAAAAFAGGSGGGGGGSSTAAPAPGGGIHNPNLPATPNARIGIPTITIGAP